MTRRYAALFTALATALAAALPVFAEETQPRELTPVEITMEPVVTGEKGPKTLDGVEEVAAEPADLVDRVPKVGILGVGSAERTYLIRLVDPAVPTHEGGEPGLQPTTPEQGQRLDPDSPSARQYREFLVEEQVGLITRIERDLGRDIDVPFTYQYAVNGLAAVLTPDEAAQVALDPSVASITLDQERELHTDSGPQWQGSEVLWDAAEQLGLPQDIKGEGIVIGTIDTGISPGNRSFADIGGDGYDHTNPFGAFLGVCDVDNPESAGGHDPEFPCNDKLIGAYFFGGANDSALDYDGHGSHTASTSGGNVVTGVEVEAPTTTTPPFDISGVAPHANVISYLGCCTLSGLTAAIDQAIIDGVDVINYSIGSSAPSALWDDFDTVGFLNARAAGIFVATSNGNDGPFFASTGSPSDAPWITSVGASTHDRHNGNALMGLDGSNGTLEDIEGKSVTGALGSTPIVYAGAFGDALCGETSGNEANFTGRIVVCDRGVFGRVEKSANVAAQGAVGFVLVNDEPHGDSLLGDEYVLPGVFISYSDGQVLKSWLAAGTDHVAAIAGTQFVVDDQYGDIMASFSSRGPNRAVDVIVPDVTAPGVDILAALGTDSYDADVHGFISGTSMASPHVAGAGALLKQARAEWTPAQAQSALMTTARNTVLNHDGDPATPYAQGAGHIDVGNAVRAGLLFDESVTNYLAADPEEGGDPRTLNLPSFAHSQCLAECSWQRTATVPENSSAPVPAGVTWTATTESDPGLALSASMSDATLSPGDSTVIDVSADVTGAPEGATLFGWVTLTPDNADVPTVTMPVAVVPSSAVLPGEVEVTTRRNTGSHEVSGIQSIEVTDFTSSVLGLVPGTLEEGSLDQDPTRDDAFDDLSQVAVYTVDVPAGASRFVAETTAFEMPDADLFVGQGSTPSAATQVCASTSPTAQETCDIADPDPGTWWIVLQNWEGSEDQPDAFALSHAVVPSEDLGNAGIDGPDGVVPVGEPYDVTFHWDIEEAQAGQTWYGTAVLGSSPGSPDDIGRFPVTLRRIGDDVTKTASVEEAAPGDTVSYEITVQPNVTDRDLTYTIVDTVPDGFTIDPASVAGGGEVDGQTITWEVEVPSPVGVVGEYTVSTPANSAQCADWSGFLDLADLNIGFAGLDGDTVAATAFGNVGPFEHFGGAFPNLTVTEDGMITVTGGYGGAPWIPQAIPNTAQPNGVIAPLWSDLELSVADGRGMRLASDGQTVAIVQWDDPFEFTGGVVGPSVGKFQAWVYNTVEDFRPEMTFEYDTLGALPAVATIGTESIGGDLATAALNAGDPSGILEEGGTICLDYEGPSFDPITLGYDVTVDQDAASGTYTNEAVHVTDDPYDEAAVATASVEVVGPEADLSIEKSGELTGEQIVYIIVVGNDGPDTATGVVVTDELPPAVSYASDSCEGVNTPPWTWEVGDLAAGETAECTVTVDVLEAGVIENTASVSGDQEDPDPEDNSSTVSIEVVPELECTDVITGRHTGPLVVEDGVTCLDGARVTGPVTVHSGAALLADGSRFTGPVKSNGALELRICDSRVTGGLQATASSAITLGDPTDDCAPNNFVGEVTVNDTAGPSVIAGNRIVGPLACAGNDPAPVNNGHPNTVVGPKKGQCQDL